MKNTLLILALCLGAILHTGCIDSESSLPGKYVSVELNSSYFILQKDNTFLREFSDGQHVAGTYTVDGDKIIMYYPFGYWREFRIVDGGVMSTAGDMFAKE